MPRSLFSALSGMNAHQQWIDLIGNNLANSNTPGYKVSRATFGSTIAETLRHASAPTSTLGGVNALQVGLGVKLAATGRTFSQGALTNTGRIFDLALEGRGFFALTDGAQRFYTRVGTFGLDAEQNLVDQGSGLRVIGAAGSPIRIDVDALFPPQATGEMVLRGNLPAVVNGPLAEVLTGNAGLEEGFAAILTGTTNSFPVTAGATYTMEVVASNGAPQTVTVTDADSDGFLTGAQVVAAIDALPDVSAQLDASNQVQISTDRTGAEVTLKVSPGATNDLAAVLGLSTTQVSGSQQVNPDADLNTLPANVTDYSIGDEIEISGIDTDGTQVSGSFVYGPDGTTIQELVDFIAGLYTDAAVSLDASGRIVVEAQTAGEADLLLTIADDAAAAGGTEWFQYAPSVTTDGTGPDEVVTSTEVYDRAGTAHTVTLTFQRQADRTWSVLASVADGEGTVLQGGADDPITGLDFDEDGAPQGLGLVDGTVSILFDGQTQPQVMTLDLGADGALTGLTQFGGQSSVVIASQDGYGDGVLSNVSVRHDGAVEGFYSNGQSRTLATVGVATFANEEGLVEAGSNLFAESHNSGLVQLGAAATNGTGHVVGGAIESSNVDTAEQFVRLIEAQRGFQANARVVTTQDEVLAEVVNLV